MKTIHQWADFGIEGVPPEDLDTRLDQHSTLSFSESIEQAVNEIWASATAESDVLHDGDSLNLLSASERRKTVEVGPASFRYYFASVSHRTGQVSLENHGLSNEEIERLLDRVRILSSFTAVNTGSELVLGVKAGEQEYLTFPGSGYLDAEEDLDAKGNLRPTRQLITRELDEELGISDRISGISVHGVFEDRDSHYNPAFISTVNVDATAKEIERRWREATDSWEFEELHFLPINQIMFRDFVTEAVAADGGSVVPSITGDRRQVTVTGKSSITPLLVGRKHFGSDWYDALLRDLGTQLEIVDVSPDSGT